MHIVNVDKIKNVCDNVRQKNMRQAITISISEEILRDVQREMKRQRFSSTSEFFRHIFRQWKKEQLLQEVKQGRKDLLSGKGRVLKSFRNLR